MFRAFAFLHAKKAIDESGEWRDDDLPQKSCIDSLVKVVEFVNWSLHGGDSELGKSTLLESRSR